MVGLLLLRAVWYSREMGAEAFKFGEKVFEKKEMAESVRFLDS